uniref:Uncharacterized protein n=1 Tax=Ditylenchus dipsaci TaxID=166011 RepID=A0A915D9N4_9BILA
MNFKLIVTQNLSSFTEIIANGHTNCPAVGSPEYSLIPFDRNLSASLYTTLTSISIVPADGGPAIASFPLSDTTFYFFDATLIPPYACEQCHTPIASTNFTLINEIVELLNGTYRDPFVVPCQSDYERPNIVLSFESLDGRQGEWVIPLSIGPALGHDLMLMVQSVNLPSAVQTVITGTQMTSMLAIIVRPAIWLIAHLVWLAPL